LGENELRTLARSRPIGPELGEDRHHPAPYFVDATLGWPGGTTAQLSCGLCAPITRPELGAWLQKRVRVVGDNGIAEAHCAGHFRRWSRDGALLEDHASTLQTYRQATTDA
jgi:hypothetical protein